MKQSTPQEIEKELDIVKPDLARALLEQRNRPFVVSVMGQTGVGKSTLLNALFNTTLPVGDDLPCTQDVTPLPIKNERGHSLMLYDMPGIGESELLDNDRLAKYGEILLESDVALWVIQADSRAVTFDVQALASLLENTHSGQQGKLINKITFVLTKADLLLDIPWTVKDTGKFASFLPDSMTRSRLEKKADYYRKKLMTPYASFMVSRTHNDGKFALQNHGFKYDEFNVFYEGMFTPEIYEEFKRHYSQYAEVFDRLRVNHSVIPCSARFKYNLMELMMAIRNKLGLNAHESFKQAVNLDSLNQMPLEDAVKLCNLRIWDSRGGRWVFDLPAGIFPDPKRGDLLGLYTKAKYTYQPFWSRIWSCLGKRSGRS